MSKLTPAIYLAKIDARINQKAAERFKVRSFPSFVYFQRGIQ